MDEAKKNKGMTPKDKFNGMSRKERRKMQREAGGFKNKATRMFFKEMRDDANDNR